jgi:hypothetical protein
MRGSGWDRASYRATGANGQPPMQSEQSKRLPLTRPTGTLSPAKGGGEGDGASPVFLM